jgi:hypothetical protein
MRSNHLIPPNAQPGDFNLKGKRGPFLLSCGCCTIRNLKCRELNKIAKKELKQDLNEYHNKEK